nr:glutathione S-transferase family protein [Gellertiella hungarica]
MILIGQYDSPFVRRVGVALRLYDLPFEHRPWSVFGDADLVRAYNPVTKVPVLVLADGDVIIESHMMLDYLDSLVPPERRLFPAEEPHRRRALKVASLGMGLAEKSVSLFYERRLHEVVSETWSERCSMQIRSVAAELDRQCRERSSPFWFGEAPGHADIAVAVAVRFAGDVLPGMLDPAHHPGLLAFAARMEDLPVMQEISQPFAAPA